MNRLFEGMGRMVVILVFTIILAAVLVAVYRLGPDVYSYVKSINPCNEFRRMAAPSANVSMCADRQIIIGETVELRREDDGAIYTVSLSQLEDGASRLVLNHPDFEQGFDFDYVIRTPVIADTLYAGDIFIQRFVNDGVQEWYIRYDPRVLTLVE